jgi:hypothetical protein
MHFTPIQHYYEIERKISQSNNTEKCKCATDRALSGTFRDAKTVHRRFSRFKTM